MNSSAGILTDMATFFKQLHEDIKELAQVTVQRYFKSEEQVKKEVQPHRFPELPKCKWQAMYEKRLKRQKEEEELLQAFKAETQKCRKERIENMRFLPNQHLQKEISKNINDFLSKQTQVYFSFLLPQIINIKSPKYFHSFFLEVLYYKIQEQLRKRQNGKNEIQNHFSLFKNQIDLFGSDNFFFQFANNQKLDEYRRSFEAKLVAIKNQIDKESASQNKKMKNIELLRSEQELEKLHYLQIARVYRYDFSPRIEKYLFSDSETLKFLKQIYPVVNAMNFELAQGKQFQLSDIGLFTAKSTIPQKEWEETYCYWYERMQLNYAFKRGSEDQELNEMQQSIKEIVKRCVGRATEKDYKQMKMGELIKWLYSFLDQLQNELMQQDKQFLDKLNSTLTNLAQTKDRVLSKYSSCPQKAKSYLCLLLPPNAPITYRNFNLLRLFTKWKKFQGDHQLQAAQIVSRLSNESTLQQIAVQLQDDYINQILPIRLFLLKKVNLYRERYEALQLQLDEQIKLVKEKQQQKQAKTAQLQNSFKTPQKRPTMVEANAPRKKNREQLSSQREVASSEMQESLDLTDLDASDFNYHEPSSMSAEIAEEENESESEESDELDMDLDDSPETPEEKKPSVQAMDIKALRNKLQSMSNAAKPKKIIELD